MFLVVKKTRIIAAILIIAVIIATVLVAVRISAAPTQAARRLLPVYGVDTEEKKVAMTFDAAWGSDKTLAILDLLDKYEIKATFFLVGIWVDKYPDLVKEIDKRGHLIGNHSTNHPHFNSLDKEGMAAEIDGTNAKIKAVTGKDIRYFRAPYGEYNDAMLGYLAEKKMQGIQWTVDSLDWKGLSASKLTERILGGVKNGAIVLCHNNSDHIADALPAVLLGIKAKNLSCVRLDELVLKENYSIDNNGIQHSVTG